MERWVNLANEGFDNYSVSDQGRVRNDRTGRILRASPNSSGTYKIGIVRLPGEPTTTFGVARLVATNFMGHEATNEFDTPINLNGDRSDNRLENLAWRPRWFAINYHKQFARDPYVFNKKVLCLDDGLEFKSAREAAVYYGVIERDIIYSINLGGWLCWPVNKKFVLTA